MLRSTVVSAHEFILPEDAATMKAVAAEPANTISGIGATPDVLRSIVEKQS
jgi:hypothetical protein